MQKGILSLRDLEESGYAFDNRPKDERILRRTTLNNEVYINPRKIEKYYLKYLKYPLNFTDMETFSTARTFYKNSMSYEVNWFQFVNLIKRLGVKDYELQEYIGLEKGVDPKINFAKAWLKSLDNGGSVLSWSPYEGVQLLTIGIEYPQHSEKIIDILGYNKRFDVYAKQEIGLQSKDALREYAIKLAAKELLNEANSLLADAPAIKSRLLKHAFLTDSKWDAFKKTFIDKENGRLVDQAKVFYYLGIYHPQMHFSYSIKKVGESMAGKELSYSIYSPDMPSGWYASKDALSITTGNLSKAEELKKLQTMGRYCGFDGWNQGVLHEIVMHFYNKYKHLDEVFIPMEEYNRVLNERPKREFKYTPKTKEEYSSF
jgi:hypothetical protein